MNPTVLESILISPRLPSLPTVAAKVIELTGDPDVDVRDVAAVVQNDQALASKILRTVNSSYYGLVEPCSTIRQSMVYLGLKTVKSLVLGFSLVREIGGHDDDDFGFVQYWQRGLYTAAAAREIARLIHVCDPEEAFLAGLLQDMGMVVMYRAFGDSYLAVKEACEHHDALPHAEVNGFGVDHACVGAELALRWTLPDMLIQAIRHHHRTADAAPQWCHVIRVAQLAAVAATGQMSGMSKANRARFARQASEWFGIGFAEARALQLSIDTAAAALSVWLAPDDGPTPSSAGLLEQAEIQLAEHQLVMHREAEALRRSNETLSQQVITDPLTGACNRQRFDNLLSLAFEDAVASGGQFGLVFCDLDRFKAVNDAHGHQVGDLVLQHVARLMAATVGTEGTVCRYGGEEFAVVLPGYDRVRAASLGERLRAEVEAHATRLTGESGEITSVPVTISLGVAVVNPDTRHHIPNPDILVQVADRAVYAAKSAGRNCVRVFAPAEDGRSAA